MSAATASLLSTVTSVNHDKSYNNNNNNNNSSSFSKSNSYFHYTNASERAAHRRCLSNDDSMLPTPQSKTTTTTATTATATTSTTSKNHTTTRHYMTKSNSFAEDLKETLLKQDICSGHIANRLTSFDNDMLRSDAVSSEYEYLLKPQHAVITTPTVGNVPAAVANMNVESTEYDAFLINPAIDSSSTSLNGLGDATQLSSMGMTASGGGGGGGSGAASISSSNIRRTARKVRTSCCIRAHAFVTRNWYLSYLLPLSVLAALLFVGYLTRDYAKQLLYWVETQNPWIIFAVYIFLFTVVSFPIVVGYFVLLITAGYLFGWFKGWLTVILGANVGIAIAHATIRSLRHRIPIQRLIKNETGRAILRVISGPRAFKVVLFTRLTPIPFGLQNAIFGISTINTRVYHLATFVGLLPAQTINVYLGSTLRSMHEVLNDNDAKLTGYVSFVIEVICGAVLMLWVVQKARKELSETLLTDISSEGKHIDIQV